MKYLSQFQSEIPEYSGRFLYKTNINKGLAESVKEGSSTEDGADDSAKLAVKEGRRQALSSFRELNDELVADIEDSSGIEDGRFQKPIEHLERDTREKVQDVLLGRRRTSRAINTGHGVSSYYHRFIRDVFNQAENAEHTIGDVDFAIKALDYTSNAFDKRLQHEKNREHNYRSWRTWFRRDEKNEQAIFDTRSKVVQKVFSDIATQLSERKTNMEAGLTEHVKRIQLEFDAMGPDEKADFLHQVQIEIDSGTPPTSTLNTRYVDGIMEGLTVEQRIEVYEKAKIDQNIINTNLNSRSNSDAYIKNGYDTSRRALNTYVDDLVLDSIVIGGTITTIGIRDRLGIRDKNITPKNFLDDESFLKEFREYLDNHGSINRNSNYFNNYSDSFGLGNHENFIAYCKILQENDDDICNTIPADFKKKILACFKWIEDKEKVNEEDLEGFSQEFEKADKNLYTRLNAFNGLVVALNAVSDLDGANKALSGIDTQSASIVQAIADFEDIKLKNKLSEEELAFLEPKYANLKKLGTEVLPGLKRKYEEELVKFKTLKEEYNKYKSLNDTYKKELKRIGKKPSVKKGGKKKALIVIQSEIDDWNTANDKVVQVQEKLAEIESKVNGKSFKKKNFNFSFGSIDLDTVNADIQVIDSDRTERGRTTKKNPNQPNDLFKNYLRRKASKDQNEKLDELLEENREQLLNHLHEKKIGSSVRIEAIRYIHGNPPTSTDILSNTGRGLVGDCIILANPKKGDGTVLYNEATNSLIIIQKGEESGRVEMVSMPAPVNVDIARDGLPSGFDMGEVQNYTATPTSIIAS